jgi:hypothetical protein
MLDFLKWCETKSLGLPTTAENTHRAGIKGIYPDAYAQRGYGYPDGYFTPTSATAVLDLKNAKKKGLTNKDDAGLPPK